MTTESYSMSTTKFLSYNYTTTSSYSHYTSATSIDNGDASISSDNGDVIISMMTTVIPTQILPAQDFCVTWISLFGIFTLISLSSCTFLLGCCLMLIYQKRKEKTSDQLDFTNPNTYSPTVLYTAGKVY